jgi:hypothetical protein
MKRQVIDVNAIAEMGVDYQAFTLSNQFPFVSKEPNRPDLQ